MRACDWVGYPDKFKRKPFVEDAVDSGATGQFICADLVAGALDAFVQVSAKRCKHSTRQQNKK